MDWAQNSAEWPMATYSRFVMCKPHKWHVQEAGSGPTLLLIHGAGGATQSWRHLFGLLSDMFRVIAIDLPGQGFTKLGAQRRCGLDEMSTDLRALCAQEGWTPTALIGHSAGAAIAFRMAEDMEPAPKIVGINAALSNFTGLAGLLFPVMAKALAATPLVAQLFTASAARPQSVQRLIAGTGSDLDSEDLEFYRKLVSDKSHVNGTLAMMAQWKLNPLLSRMDRHPSPTVLIIGENDQAVPPQTSRDIAKRLPDAKLVALPNLGHLAHEENAPAVAAVIRRFLGGGHAPKTSGNPHEDAT